MAHKSQPLKPDRPLSSIVFSDTGKVRLNIEHLPQTQKGLELSIGRKFVAALAHFRKEILTDVTPATEEPSDLICRRSDGQIVKIQIVEVVDQMMRKLQEQRQSYSAGLLSDYDVLKLFSGYRLTLADEGTKSLLPSLRTQEGKMCLAELASSIRNLGDGLSSLPAGKTRVRKWKIGPSEVRIFAMCERVAESDANVSPVLHWSGGFVIRGDERRFLIADSIEKKVKQYYSKPSEEFWLLVYSSDILPKADAPEILEATRVLENSKHPFDKVWFLFPYSNRDLGHLVLVWPPP